MQQPMMKQQPLFGVLCIGQSPMVIQPHQSSSNTTTTITAQQQPQQELSSAVYHEITIDSIMTFPVAFIVVYWLPLSCHMPSPLSSSHAIIYSSQQQSSSNHNNHNNLNNHNHIDNNNSGDIDMDDMNENWTCHGCISLPSLNNTKKNGTSHHHHPSSIQFQVMNQSSVTIRVIPISQQHNHPLSLPSLPLSSHHPHHLLDQLLSLDQLNEYMQERKQKYHRQKKKAINQNTTHTTNNSSSSSNSNSNSSGKQQLNQVNDTLVQCYNELYKSSLQVKALAKSDLKTLERKCQDYVIHECIIPSQQHQNNNNNNNSSNESMLNWASEQLNYINDQMFYKLMRIDQVILTVQYHQSTTATTTLSTTTTTTTTPLLSRVMMKNKEQSSTFLKRDEGYEKQYQFVVRYLVACYERIQDKCLDMLMDLDANQLKQRKQMNVLIQQRIQQLHSMQSK